MQNLIVIPSSFGVSQPNILLQGDNAHIRPTTCALFFSPRKNKYLCIHFRQVATIEQEN